MVNDERYRKTMPIKIDVETLRNAHKSFVPTLTVIKGKNVGARIQIHENKQHIIGRNEDCDIMIDDSSVSRAHAVVWSEWDKNERVVKIKDLQSTNKTLVNGKEITIEALTPGDKVYIGESLLSFEVHDSIVAQFYEKIINKAEESEIDALTQLLSSRFFHEKLPEMYEEVVKTGRSFSIVIIDIDHFKSINDGKGHDVGDEILKNVSIIVKKSIRKEDMAIRYGGDEIVLALPNTSLNCAKDVAERLRISVAEFDCTFLNLSNLTVSIGVSTSHGKNGIRKKFEEIMKCADAALYESKRKGRNAVSVDKNL